MWRAALLFTLILFIIEISGNAADLTGPIILWVDETVRYEADALFEESTSIPSLLWTDYEEICSSRLEPSVWSKLRASTPFLMTPNQKKWAKLSKLKSEVVDIQFDPNSLELKILFTAAAKITRTISLQDSLQNQFKDLSSGSHLFSGSFTTIGILGLHSQGTELTPFEREPFTIQTEQVLNFQTTTIHNKISLQEGMPSERGWSAQRTMTQLTHDWPSQDLRWTLGDLQAQGNNLSPPADIFGIAVQREFFSPESRAQSLSTGQFYLELSRKSRVEVWIGNLIAGVFYLEPGRYDFRDFPTQLGLMNAELRVEDDLGKKSVYQRNYFISPRLLATGKSYFQYSLGLKKEAPSDYLIGFAHRVGLLSDFTAEFDFKKSRDLHSEVLGFSWAHTFGVFESTFATANSSGLDTVSSQNKALFLWSFSETTDFQGPLSLFRNWIRLKIDSVDGVSAHWTALLNSSLSFGAQLNSKMTQLSLSYFTPFGWSTRVNWEIGNTFEIFLSRNLSIPSTNSLIRYKSQDRSLRLETSYQPDPTAGTTVFRLGAETTPQSKLVDSEMRYFGNRWEFAWNQQTEISPRVTLNRGQHQFQFGSSLVFTGNHFGFARPASQGFLRIYSGDALRGLNLQVNRNRHGQSYAHSDFLGDPILVLPATPYTENSISIDLEDPNHFLLLPERDYPFFPGFKSGSEIQIGLTKAISIQCRLLKPDQTPIKRIEGFLTNIEGKKINFQTDDSGSFFVEKIFEGRWNIEVDSQLYGSYPIDIPKGSGKYLDLGSIKLPPCKKQQEGSIF